MHRHGFNGTLHRGKSNTCAFSRRLRSRVLAALERHMEELLGCAGLLSKEFAQTFSPFHCSSRFDHMPTDLGDFAPVTYMCKPGSAV